MVHGLTVEVVRKDIKNLHLAVYPPQGRVRAAVPLSVDDEAVRLAVLTRLAWIRRQQARFREQARQSRREAVSGETHYFQGRRCRMRLREAVGRSSVRLRGTSTLELTVPPGTAAEDRERVVLRWYRGQLRALLSPLVEKWERELGVRASAWGIRRMKTKWGSCNTATGRVWFNLELVKKPRRCLEYLVVHELLHLFERCHDDRFRALLDHHFPSWRTVRDELNQAPLAHEAWGY